MQLIYLKQNYLKSSLITPNIPEAEILTKIKISSKEDMIFAAHKLINLELKMC